MSSPQRILIIGINYSPELTGIGKYAGEFGAWLAGRGEQVQVVTAFPYYPGWRIPSSYRSGWFRRERIDGVQVLRCPLYVPKEPTPLRRMMQDLSFLLTGWLAVTCLLISGHRYDRVWVSMPSFLSGLIGGWVRLWHSDMWVDLHVMDLQVDAARSMGMLRHRRLIGGLLWLEARILRKADRVSTLSTGMRERLLQKGLDPRRLTVLPIWVDTDRLQPAQPDPIFLKGLGIPAGKRVVLYSGAIGEKQGLGEVLELAEMVADAYPELFFVISGEGPYALRLRRAAEGRNIHNLLFIPLQPEDVFPTLLNSAWLHLVIQRDVFSELFMPSKLSAILSVGGLALVTADPESSLGRMIETFECAWMEPVNQPDRIFSGIITLLKDEMLQDRIRINARELALRQFSKERLLQGYWLAETNPEGNRSGDLFQLKN